MTYEFVLHIPGVEFTKKGDPVGKLPQASTFRANSHTEALTIARDLYERSALGRAGHFNVGLLTDGLADL